MADNEDAESNESTRLELYDIIEELSTTGRKDLDAGLLRRLKSLCKASEMSVNHAYHVLATQLEKEHSEIRYSVVQIVDVLFMRSALFRALLVNDLHQFFVLSVETDSTRALPPPQARAFEMRLMTLKCIKKWNETFGDFYKQLRLGYEHLSRVGKIDFDNLREQEAAQDRAQREAERRKELFLASRLNTTKTQMAECTDDVLACIKQANSCFSLLLPQTSEGGTQESQGMDASSLGINPACYSLTVFVPRCKVTVRENDDNRDILASLRDTCQEVQRCHLPMVQSWLSIMSQLPDEQSSLAPVLELKNELKNIVEKFTELNVVRDVAGSDEDDFIDVPEAVLVDTPRDDGRDPIPVTPSSSGSEAVVLPGSSKETSEEYSSRKSRLLADAPFVTYDADLRYWGDRKLHITPIIKLDSLHRFWNNSEHDDEFIPKDLEESLHMRAMPFAGMYERVKWKCRAPLPNGMLCQREDRKKCPFHGKIVARSALGCPEDEAEAENDELRLKTLADRETKEIQQEIEQQTGVSNIVQRKVKRVGISKLRYSRLTDTKRSKRDPRKRLERKVMTKAALERVGAIEADVIKRRSQEAFGGNWNYQITQ